MSYVHLACLAGIIITGLLCTPAIQMADARPVIPVDEYLGYHDALGIYTVVGNVKNAGNFAVIPIITISVVDGSQTVSETIRHVPLPPYGEIPFKVKFPDITSRSPILEEPVLTFERTIASRIPIDVLYDNTLVKHEDGHITGRIQNNGEQTIHYPKIFAVVHGHDAVLDIAQNIKFIEKIEPGEIVEFSMYPDPAITEDILYYSCFGPVDTTVIPLTAQKNGGDYNFRYDSGSRYSGQVFDEEGTTMTLRGYNSFAISTYANFEFPVMSGNEKFVVTVNDQPIDFIQSMDELGYWHIAFSVEPISQDIVKISGFDKGIPPDLPRVPEWIKLGASWWAAGEISADEFLEGINFLFEKAIISVPSRDIIAVSQWNIPPWVAVPAQMWSEDQITDDEFLAIIEYLVQVGILVV